MHALWYNHQVVYIKQSAIPGAGRGTYAASQIQMGDVIEVCPVIEIPKSETGHVFNSILAIYLFFFGPDKDRAMIALGFGSLYNHASEPNASYNMNFSDMTITFQAAKTIQKDEEITITTKMEILSGLLFYGLNSVYWV